MLLHNGPIYTMDPRLPRVAALAVADEKIAGGVDVREGEVDTVGHERVDLDGRCVLPGFTDSHIHFLMWALGRAQLDLHGCASRGEALRRVGEHLGDGWLLGFGWLDAEWADGPPTVASLDEVTGDRPAALWAHDHHTLWVNSAALAAAGAPSREGPLQEWEAFRFPLPEPSGAERTKAVREAMAEANGRGVVSVHDFQATGGREVWQRLDADRRLNLRVRASFPLSLLDAALELELRTGFGSDLLRVGPAKAFMDGTLGSRTAWMLDGSGDQLLSEDELAEAVERAARGGLGVAVHAIGDGANRAALNAFARTRHVWEDALVRPRIEHAQCVAPADVARFAELGVIASMQPTMLHSDRDVADERWPAITSQVYRWRDLLDAGAHVIFGSDAPIEEVAPLRSIEAAVHRTLDDRPAWHGDQALSVADAVLGHTAAAAYACGDERWRGCLLPGYAADLVVLDTDIVEHPDRIGSTSVVATMLAGRWVYGRPPW